MERAAKVSPPRPPGRVVDHPETWQGGVRARAGWVVDEDPTFHAAVSRLAQQQRPKRRRHLRVAA